MSNPNNLPHHHGANEDDIDGSSDETEQNLTITNAIYIVVVIIIYAEQPTPLSQPVRDERATDIIDQNIDRLIEYQPDNLGAIIPTLYWFMFILFSILACQCWPLLTFVFFAYQLITYNHQPVVNSFELQSRYSNLQSQYAFDPNRDAQAEGRTSQPIEEDIPFSSTIEVVDHVPFGTPNTQLHDIIALVGLNNTQQPDLITNDENVNNNDGEIIVPDTPNENVQITTNEHNEPQTAVDNPTCNINPLRSVEPQDDRYSSDSSDEEDSIMSSGSGFDSDDEDDSADDNKQTGRTVPILGNLPNSIQNNHPPNQTNIVDEQPAASIPIHNEVAEIGANVAAPADHVQEVIIPPIPSRGILIPKSRDLIHPNSESTV